MRICSGRGSRIHRSLIHPVYATGIIWVHDAETTESGEMPLVWMDEYGRTVREARMGENDLDNICGRFHEASDMDTPWFNHADVGEAYEDGKWP